MNSPSNHFESIHTGESAGRNRQGTSSSPQSVPTRLANRSIRSLHWNCTRNIRVIRFDNAGAIATVSLLNAKSADDRWNQIISTYSLFAGRDLTVNEEVYKSESDTNAHNRGISWLLKNSGKMFTDPDQACDVYTRQCSVAITCRDLAIMGGTIANHGVNPVTKKQVISRENVQPILAEMAMNGLYDNTGTWLYNTGLPGKSGVGGGILAIVPGVCALAVFAPPSMFSETV